MDEQTRMEIDSLKKSLADMKRELSAIKETATITRARLDSPRVKFKNFEGAFKTRTDAEPTSTDTDWENGTILLTNVSGTQKLFARIDGSWYSATLT